MNRSGQGSSSYSRRDFFRGASVASLGLAGAVALYGCAPTGGDKAQAANSTSGESANGLETRFDTDILIVGGGQAGFAAGIYALELGVEKVLIIDKASGEGMDWGGSSYICGGSLLVPKSDSAEDAQQYTQAMYSKGQEKPNIELLTVLGEKSWDGYQWMIDHGVEYSEPTSVFPAYPAVQTAVSDMPTTMGALRDAYTSAGGSLEFGVKAQNLILDASGVCGVMAKDKSGFFDIKAKQTILCTGGYAANKQFLEDHVGENGDEIMCRARESATGDGIAMAQAVGGYTVNSCGLQTIHLSAVDPVAVQKGQPGNEIPYFIAINADGKRFVDEAQGSVRHGQAVFAQAVQRDGLITDSKVLDKVQATLDKLHGQGVETWQVDTLEEMAEIFGCPADVLKATVDEFNAHVVGEATEGLSPDKTAKAQTIDTPPYYGIYPLVPGTSLTYGGIATNTKAEVLQSDGEVIPNLYAAGEGVGG
ncbi:MAG: FAD-binding protein, partial [Raoultibacter sp.]